MDTTLCHLSGIANVSLVSLWREKVTNSIFRSSGKAGIVTGYKDYSTHSKIHFVITCPDLHKMSNNQITFAFKLGARLSTNNMHLFDASGNIKKYGSTNEILQDFFAVRLEYYAKRRVVYNNCTHSYS